MLLPVGSSLSDMSDSGTSALTPSPRMGTVDAMGQDDLQILKDCLDGRPGAWEAFVRRFAPPLAEACHRALLRRSRPAGPQEVDDMLQTVFLAFVEKDMKSLRAYREQGQLVTYLSAIAMWLVLHDRTSRAEGRPGGVFRLSQGHPDPAAGPAEQVEAGEAQERLHQELEKLPPRVCLAFTLQTEGSSLRDIGRALGISEDTVAQLLSRARATLRERLDPPER